MFDKYFRKNKRTLCPWIKDFTDPQNEIRYSNNIKDMDYFTWLFFHPSAYKIIFYGFNLIGIFVVGLFALLFYFKDFVIGGIVCCLLAGYFVYNFIKKLDQRKSIKDATMYDFYMREYPDEDT